MSNLLSLTTTQLRRAADLKEKIAALTKELTSILGTPDTVTTKAPKKRKKMSAAARAKISAAAKKRWAKVKATGKKSL
jgi:hypothetical protein